MTAGVLNPSPPKSHTRERTDRQNHTSTLVAYHREVLRHKRRVYALGAGVSFLQPSGGAHNGTLADDADMSTGM